VLIEGETGTGKTALAHALHAASSRAHRPFVVVDCSSIPPTQIESVLFGHDEAALTGAHAARPGAFEAAHGGTVFLDEIGELPLELQPKLLRLLESHQVQRIGAAAPSSLDVRIIAATNRDLRDMVSRGTCRADLYYRLAVVTLQIPPLRARREDIPGLVAHFYRELGQSKRPSEALLCELSRLDWPGNVRELRSAVERAVLLGELSVDDILDRKEAALAELTSGDPERRATFTDEFEPQLTFRDAKERATALWERWYVAQLLRHTHGNLSEAARVAHSDRGYLRKLLRKHSP
jgi:DNA-binding NtrC family response regulator